MAKRFQHVAIVGKHQAQGIRPILDEIADFVMGLGLEVSLERETALNTGMTGFEALTTDELGSQCDVAIVVGGDGTMLGFAREMARYGTPLVGINQAAWASSPTSRSSISATRWRRSWPATTRWSTARCWRAPSGATARTSSRAWR